MKRVYEPCPYCKGQGDTERHLVRYDVGMYEWEGGTCSACRGSGKGKLKELIEE